MYFILVIIKMFVNQFFIIQKDIIYLKLFYLIKCYL